MRTNSVERYLLIMSDAVSYEIVITETEAVGMVCLDFDTVSGYLPFIPMLGFQGISTCCAFNQATINKITKVVNIDHTSPESDISKDTCRLRDETGMLGY